jgi:phosphonate transport system ATP-binding protein
LKTQTQTNFAVETLSLALVRGERLLFEKMTWQLPKGTFLAVTGASGAGKSSFLACLSGLISAKDGTFELSAKDEKSIGLVFQNFRLSTNLSVLKNVLCGRLGEFSWWQTLFSFPKSEQQKAFQILQELGLENLVHRQVRKISGGEQQRTAIARALLQNPKIILADEPTSNLDVILAKQVLSILRQKCETENCTVIAVLHDSRMVEEFADYELKIGAEFENGWRFSQNRLR